MAKNGNKNEFPKAKLVVIGQGPSRTTIGEKPWTGKSATRLFKLFGITEEQFREKVHAVNLTEEYFGKNGGGKGDAFKIAAGQFSGFIESHAHESATVIVCGKMTAKACGVKNPEWFEWLELNGRKVVVIPHPSGINLWWNDSGNVAKAEEFLRGVWSKSCAG